MIQDSKKSLSSWLFGRANLSELYFYRHLLWVLARRDIRVRFKQTILGLAWGIIGPAMSILVFTLLFGKILNVDSGNVPYPIFLFSALLAWNLFAACVNSGTQSVRNSSQLITKVYFPRILIPAASFGVPIIDTFISFLLLGALMAYYNIAPTVQLIALPVLVFLLMLIALGISLVLSALSVRYRDFSRVTEYLLRLLMFATPVVYPASALPESLTWLADYNPIATLLEAVRASILGMPIEWLMVGQAGMVAIVLFLFGAVVFSRLERHFADII